MNQEQAPDNQKPKLNIPGYRFQRLLGRGGMAAVYLAIQESVGREVAIKVLEPEQAAAENFSERFLREAKIVSQLSHPHIVTVYDAGVRAGYHYYSMEYIDGPNLKEALPNLKLSDRLRAVKDVAQALDYAGKKGYVHRDVKPENIMIRKSDGHVILTDFGIARGGELTNGMTQTGKAIGTPHYMSPEQTKGVHVDPRSDIYSLGVVLYLSLSGHVPYDADSAIAVGIKHLSAPIPALPPDMKFFQEIINNCLSKKPEHRYQTAGQLFAALDAIPTEAIQAIEARTRKTGQVRHNIDAATMADIDYAAATEMLDDSTSGWQSSSITFTTPTSINTGRQTITRRKGRSGTLALIILFILLGATAAGAWYGRSEIARVWNSLALPGMNEIIANITDEIRGTDKGQAVSIDSGSESTVSGQVVDPVEYLYEQLEADPGNAKILAQSYRALLAAPQPDPEARHRLKLMHDWFEEQLQIAFNNHNVTRARELVDAMQLSFPRLKEAPRFVQIQGRLEQAEKVQAYIDEGENYLQQQALITPPDANAHAAYRAALELIPDHPEAQQGIKRIIDIFHNQAIQHQTRGELQPALDKVNAGLTVDAEDPELLSMQRELQQALDTRRRVASLNEQGNKAFAQGKLLYPEKESAFYYYQKALKLQPGNPTAQEGKLKIQQQKLFKVQFEIREKRFKEAETRLNELEGWFGKTESIKHSWDTLYKAIENSLPRVSRLTYSDLEIRSLNLNRPAVVKPIRNLYFGFAYENLPTSKNQIEAFLMDGTGQVAMAHKTLTLERQEGEHYASLLLPINEMQDGRYRLLLLLGEKPLLQTSLYIEVQ